MAARKARVAGTGVAREKAVIGSLRRKLAAKLGARNVLTGGAAAAYGGDKWFAARAPELAVLPGNTAEVSQVLRLADSAGVPVTPRGAGFGYVGGCVPVRGGIVLSTERMNRIREIHTGDFVAVVGPGVITGVLQEAVRRKGLFYPPDPASLKDCSIGGNIATNAGGPRCLKYGVTRHYVLGLEVVLADGTIARIGGRTHKNKAGFDLVGLFVGSEGLLGVVTEATLRLLPHPPTRAVLSAGFRDVRTAARAVRGIFAAGFLPAALEIADRFTLEAARAGCPSTRLPPGRAHLLVELDGQARSVRSESRDLGRLLKDFRATRVETALDEEGCVRLWELRRGFSESLKATGLRKLNQDIAIPRGRLVELMRFTADLQARSGISIASFGHAGDGNIHVNIMVGDYNDPAERRRADQAVDELFTRVLAWEGTITGEHGIGVARLPWWPQAASQNVRDLHRAIKRAVDPRGILNPGKFA